MRLSQKITYLCFVTAALATSVGDSLQSSGSLQTHFPDDLCLLQQHISPVPASARTRTFGFGIFPGESEEKQAAPALLEEGPDTLLVEQPLSEMQPRMQQRPSPQQLELLSPDTKMNQQMLKGLGNTPFDFDGSTGLAADDVETQPKSFQAAGSQDGAVLIPSSEDQSLLQVATFPIAGGGTGGTDETFRRKPGEIETPVVSASEQTGNFGFEALPEEDDGGAVVQRPPVDVRNNLRDEEHPLSEMPWRMQQSASLQRIHPDSLHTLNSWQMQRTPLFSRTHSRDTFHNGFSGPAGEPMPIPSKFDLANSRKQQQEQLTTGTSWSQQLLRVHENDASDPDESGGGSAADVPILLKNPLVMPESQIGAGSIAPNFDHKVPRVATFKVEAGSNVKSQLAHEPAEIELSGILGSLDLGQKEMYTMFIVEAVVFILVCLFSFCGYLSKKGDDDQDLENDALEEFDTYCWPCEDLSECCTDMMGNFGTGCCLLVFLVIANLVYWHFCAAGVVDKLANQVFFYVFLGVVFIVVLFMLCCCLVKRIRRTEAVQAALEVKHQIHMISHIFENQYGKKYLAMMKKAGFGGEATAVAKQRMQKAGNLQQRQGC